MNKICLYTITVLLVMMGFAPRIRAQEHSSDSLTHYIQVAIANNPGVKSQQFAYEAFLEKIPQAGAYPDPELSIEAYTMPMEIIGGRSFGTASIMQMFPWFGTRKAARTEAGHMANMQDRQYRETVDDLILQVSTQWYAMQQLKEQLRNNEENRKLLEQLEQLAIRKFSAPSGGTTPGSAPPARSEAAAAPVSALSPSAMGGMSMGSNTRAASVADPAMNMSSGPAMGGMSNGGQSGMSEVLRIQLELVAIENSIESLHSQIKAEKARFNTLLNRASGEEVQLGDEIHQVTFSADETAALSAIQIRNPMLGMITEEGLAYKAKAEMDRKMSYPMIGLGVAYMAVGKSSNTMFAMDGMNGRDMVMPMVTMSLPVFRKKYDAQQREGRLWWKSSEENFRNTFNRLKGDYYGFKSQLDDAGRMIRLYEKQTALAHTTYQLIIKEFVTGRSDLTNVIQVQRQLLDYQLKKAEAITNYNTMVASIRKLTATYEHILID